MEAQLSRSFLALRYLIQVLSHLSHPSSPEVNVTLGKKNVQGSQFSPEPWRISGIDNGWMDNR